MTPKTLKTSSQAYSKCLNLCLLIFLKKYVYKKFWISTYVCICAPFLLAIHQCKAEELTLSLFMNCPPLFVLNVSGSHLLSLSLLQAIPLPMAWKEDPSALGKYHKCAQAHPLLGDHAEWALSPRIFPCVSSDPHAQSEDHRPGLGWRPQEHAGP